MKNATKLLLLASSFATLFCASCQKNQSTAWDDAKTVSQLNKRGNPLWGNDEELETSFSGPIEEDFIPLKEEDLRMQFAETVIPQPKEAPGEVGSSLPSADKFHRAYGELAKVFQSLRFNTDDYILRGKETLACVDKIADYLKKHPKTYIFVEGHCDERGPQAYNLALGTRRANYVRTLLVEKGVNLNQVHTISYGKEHPLVDGHTPEIWAKNRRADFKIYEKP